MAPYRKSRLVLSLAVVGGALFLDVDWSRENPPAGRAAAQAIAQRACNIDKFSPVEKRGFGVILASALVQSSCKEFTGKYITLDQLLSTGCDGGGKGRVGPMKSETGDPRADPDYEFRVSLSADQLAMAVTPRRTGLAGFYSNGATVHCNLAGPASAKSPSLGDPASIIRDMISKGK